ncbi:hypothetical protein Btru_062094 [Bulinus truncatus]|nr:hypothetical protein Btru_062094 [Bulinus truncatus]
MYIKEQKEQTNNNIQADPVDQKTSRDKLPKMLLSRNAVSTMPEITEISADSVRHLDSSVTDESVLSTATLSRNNSNIKSDLDVPPENREERKGSVAFSILPDFGGSNDTFVHEEDEDSDSSAEMSIGYTPMNRKNRQQRLISYFPSFVK